METALLQVVAKRTPTSPTNLRETKSKVYRLRYNSTTKKITDIFCSSVFIRSGLAKRQKFVIRKAALSLSPLTLPLSNGFLCLVPSAPPSGKHANIPWDIFEVTKVEKTYTPIDENFKMAVIGRSESGFLVDHERSISESVSALSLSSKEGLFALFEPYFRPSHSADNNSYGKLKRKVNCSRFIK